MATRTEILLKDIKLETLVADLPDGVYPIDVCLAMDRRSDRDTILRDANNRGIEPPRYPIPLLQSTGMPYIPRRTVRFTNPVEDAQGTFDVYEFEMFVDKLQTIVEDAAQRDPSAPERLYLTNLRLCEFPGKYLRRDPSNGVIADAYRENITIPIATFGKTQRVTEAVRETLDEAVSGHVIKPMAFTDVTEVTLKPYSNAKTRRKYFTAGQAATQGGTAPKEYGAPTWNNVKSWFPALVASELITEFEFTGRWEDSERFIEESAMAINGGGSS